MDVEATIQDCTIDHGGRDFSLGSRTVAEAVRLWTFHNILQNLFKLGPSVTTMNVSVHEDNASKLILAQCIPPEYTPSARIDSSL